MLAGGLLLAAACQQGDSNELVESSKIFTAPTEYATPTPESISLPATQTREAATASPTPLSPTATPILDTSTVEAAPPDTTPDLQGSSNPEPELKENPPSLETPPPYDGGSVSTAEAGGPVDVVALAQQVFGANWLAAVRVAWCESTFSPGATGAEGEMGIWQIHPRWHPDATYDPLGNALAAYRISAGGVNWSAWTHGPERAAGADCSSSKPAWDRMTARSPPAYDGSDTSGSLSHG